MVELLNRSRRRRAEAAIGRRDLRGAISELEHQIERDGQDSLSTVMLAQCYEWVHDYDRAIFHANHFLTSNPNDLLALKLMVRCHREVGDVHRTYAFACRALAEEQLSNLVFRQLNQATA